MLKNPTIYGIIIFADCVDAATNSRLHKCMIATVQCVAMTKLMTQLAARGLHFSVLSVLLAMTLV